MECQNMDGVAWILFGGDERGPALLP